MYHLETWDPSPAKSEKMPALQLGAIHGVLPFAGKRNPLTRSNTAHRISTTFATPATNGQKRVHLFESEIEYAVAQEVLLSPDLFELEAQLPPIIYLSPAKRDWREHYFDLRITFTDGFRRAVFVRNETSLAKTSTWDEIDAIFAATPPEFADDKIVVSGIEYCRARRENLRRICYAFEEASTADDAHVACVAREARFRLIQDLVGYCDLPAPRAWRAILRLIGRTTLLADWNATLNRYSRIWIA